MYGESENEKKKDKCFKLPEGDFEFSHKIRVARSNQNNLLKSFLLSYFSLVLLNLQMEKPNGETGIICKLIQYMLLETVVGTLKTMIMIMKLLILETHH